MKDGTYLVPSLLSEAAASVQARAASARPAYRAHTCTRTCRLGRGPRARLHDAATHKRLGARLSAAAIERRDELFVHLCCLFVQALRSAVTSAAVRYQSNATRRAFFFASSASLCSCGAVRERRARLRQLRPLRATHLKRVFLGPDRSEKVLLVHGGLGRRREQTLGVTAARRTQAKLGTSRRELTEPTERATPGAARSTPLGVRELSDPAMTRQQRPCGPPSQKASRAGSGTAQHTQLRSQRLAMAGVLRSTQLVQRLAPRTHGALAQRSAAQRRGFAAGALVEAASTGHG